MIIHCTQKLAKKIPQLSNEALTETSPLGSWHAHIYTIDRSNVLLFCHDDTRYTLFLPGLRKPHFAELGRFFKLIFTASLANMGVPDNHIRRAELCLGAISFDCNTNRSVQGSLNQMRKMLDGRIAEVPNVMLLDPLEVSHWLCHNPVSIGKNKTFWMADEAMAQRVMQL